MSEKTRKTERQNAEARSAGAVALSERELAALPAGGMSSDPEWKYVPVRRFSS
jgi:hypothetical protein